MPGGQDTGRLVDDSMLCLYPLAAKTMVLRPARTRRRDPCRRVRPCFALSYLRVVYLPVPHLLGTLRPSLSVASRSSTLPRLSTGRSHRVVSERASELENTRSGKEGLRCPRPSTTLSDTRTRLSCSLFLDQEWEDGETELDHEERREREGEIKRKRKREKQGDVENQRERKRETSGKGDVMG